MSNEQFNRPENPEDMEFNRIGWDFKPVEDDQALEQTVTMNPEVRRHRYSEALIEARKHAKPLETSKPLDENSPMPMEINFGFPEADNVVYAEDFRDFPMLLSLAMENEYKQEAAWSKPSNRGWMKDAKIEDLYHTLEHEGLHCAAIAGKVKDKEGNQKPDTDSIKMGVRYNKYNTNNTVAVPFVSIEGTVALKDFVLLVIKPGTEMSKGPWDASDEAHIEKIKAKLVQEGKMSPEESLYDEDSVERIFDRIEQQEQASKAQSPS